jgi:hypothetical protein
MAIAEEITESHHVICEGPDDIALFSRLLEARRIYGFNVSCSRNVAAGDSRCLGRNGFSRRVVALQGLVAPLPRTKGIIIATDCDDDPAERFQHACNAFVENGLPAPRGPFLVATNALGIKTGVMVFPRTSNHGGLETLLLECSGFPNNTEPLHRCIQEFCACAHSENWQEKDLHKVQLRLLIAGQRPDDPSLGLSMWVSDAHRRFSLNHPALDVYANFLRDFLNA